MGLGEAMRPTRDAVNEQASGRAGEHLLDAEDAAATVASGDAGNGGGRGWAVHGGGGEIRRSPAGSDAKRQRSWTRGCAPLKKFREQESSERGDKEEK